MGDRRVLPGAPMRDGRRMSVSALYQLKSENDTEVEDELTRAQRRLKEIKGRISTQSKKNFVLERDVRYLDSRIALLIQNRMALDESDVASLQEEDIESMANFPDDRKRQHYGNLFFLLQTEPRHMAKLTRLVSLAEIDTLLQTVMFTLYGNQYESREEHLLLTMFQLVLAAQFEAATDFNSLLRANTPVSRMMTTYTRRGPGQSYLKNVLSGPIEELLSCKDMNLEINPLKVYEHIINKMETETGEDSPLPRGVTAEYAAQLPEVKQIIGPRVEELMRIANKFLTVIIDSLDQVPYGIRWICKQIRVLTKRKYSDASEYMICSLTGGFFLLRFINPAVVTPQAYMLVEGSPAKGPRRVLTLVAKLLQNLSNKPSYAKEEYMAVLHPFVEQNTPRIQRFLNDLCEVGDFFESLEMDQYLALSKKDLSLNITLNELFNTHALLEQHKEVLSPDPSTHLRIMLSDIGAPPPQVSRKDNKAMVLPLFSRWETPINDQPTMLEDANLTPGDVLYLETKNLLIQIMRSVPSLTNARAVTLSQVFEIAFGTRDPGLVRKCTISRDNVAKLEAEGLIKASDGYRNLIDEVLQELALLRDLREKIQSELQSLEGVYKTICDHNDYLRSQLESYKAYLQNVRIQSSGASSNLKDKGKGNKKGQVLGPFKFSHSALEKDGVIVESDVPENRRQNIYFNITSPVPGTFIIALHYKGREKAILEMDLKLDDLLEKQQDNIQLLDLEYVQLNVNKMLHLLNKTFLKR